MAPLIWFCNLALPSSKVARRLSVSSRTPPASPASIMAIMSLSNTFGQRRIAVPMPSPWLTSSVMACSARLNSGIFCCWAISVRPRTIGTPASTRAASLLANRAFSLTPGFASSRRERSALKRLLAPPVFLVLLGSPVKVCRELGMMPRCLRLRLALPRSLACSRMFRFCPDAVV